MEHRPFKPNFPENDYLPSYLSLMDQDHNSKKSIEITGAQYPMGYTLCLIYKVI